MNNLASISLNRLNKISPLSLHTAVKTLEGKSPCFTPKIQFEEEEVLCVEGDSNSLFSGSTYTILRKEIEHYFFFQNSLKLKIDLQSININTVMGLLDLFMLLNEYYKNGKIISVEWKIYEDKDIYETAIDLNNYCIFPLVYIVS